MPDLTVITVVKDDVAGLERTLASLDGEDLDGVELVVVDGSADADAVPRALAAHPLLAARYLWARPEGVYAAMNAGLGAASGTYVHFLNGGDALAGAGVLARMVDRLRERAPIWAYGGVRFVAEDGTPLPEPAWDYSQERDRLFARGRFPAHQGVVMDRTVLAGLGGFDPRYRVAADYAAILAFSRLGEPDAWPFVVAEFTTGGLSTRQWREAQREFHRARREVLAPRGWSAAREQWDTAVRRAATEAYRALWAPGRPLAGAVRSLRPPTRPR